MNTVVIHGLSGREYQVALPSAWAEVPTEIYPSLARVYLRGSQYMNEFDKLVRTLALLMGDQVDALWDIVDLQRYDLLKLVEWVYASLEIIDNPISSFDFNGRTYIGPAGDFSNIRFGEFVMAEAFFSQYHASDMQSPEALQKLVAVLYREQGIGDEYVIGSVTYRGDVRQKFNGNLIDYQSALFADLDLAIQDGIFLWYASARDRFFSYYKNIFKRKKSAAKTDDKAVQWGWFGVFDDLLGEKGRTAESLEDEFVSTTLMSLERAQIKVKESKK